jgi:hypothetical protein
VWSLSLGNERLLQRIRRRGVKWPTHWT